MDDVDLKERSHGRAREKEGHESGSVGPSNPWDAEIDVILTSAGPPAQFSIATCLPIDPTNGNIEFNNAGRPGFKVKFRLYDQTGSGYAFPQGANKQDAVWSEVGTTGCPNTGDWDVFQQNSIVVTDNGATLVVLNPNPSPAQGPFRYTLNVTTTGGPPYLALDPGGTNNNGSTAK